MGRALIEEVRRRYSARASVLHGAGLRRSPTEEFVRSFTARWEEAADLFFQSLASLLRGSAHEGEDPSVVDPPAAGSESRASPAGKSPVGRSSGGDDLQAARRLACREPVVGPRSRGLEFPGGTRPAPLRRDGRAEGRAEAVRTERPGGIPRPLAPAEADLEFVPQAPGEPERARRSREGTPAPVTEEREAVDSQLGPPPPDGGGGREECLSPAARRPRRDALEGADALAVPPQALELPGAPERAPSRPRGGEGEIRAPGDFRERPRVPEGAADIVLPASSELDRIDAGDAELERMEAFLDERKRLEEALREWEGKGF